jgi:anti-sigma B factor antagonist
MKNCTITTREMEGVTIFDFAGRMSFPEPHLQPILTGLLKEGRKGFVINLSGVTYMDSYGLNDLVNAYTAVKGAGARLVLLQPNPNVKKTIEITMKTIFEFFDDETTAIQAVR